MTFKYFQNVIVNYVSYILTYKGLLEMKLYISLSRKISIKIKTSISLRHFSFDSMSVFQTNNEVELML